MNLYLLEQDYVSGYDTYDNCVVCAKDEKDARNIHPSEYVTHIENKVWMGTRDDNTTYENNSYDWVSYEDIDKIEVTYLGRACKSF